MKVKPFYCLLIGILAGIHIPNSAGPSFSSPDEMLAFVKTFLPIFPIILEAGGHFGEDTHRMKSVWPQAKIHVFEPLPSSYKKMVNSTSDLSDVACYPYALTSYSGKTDFYIGTPNNAASSIGFPVEWNQHEFDKTPIQVPCTTLDKWAAESNISHIDFMWLDMEGHELYALQHALSILDTVTAIYTEIAFTPLRVNGCLYPDIKAFLESHGFCEVWKSCSTGRFGDALFVKKHLVKN